MTERATDESETPPSEADIAIDQMLEALRNLDDDTIVKALNGSRFAQRPRGEWTLPQQYVQPMADFIACFDHDQVLAGLLRAAESAKEVN